MTPSTISVGLIDENVEVWRPVEAEPLGHGVFRIMNESTDPEIEVWEFITGELVACEPRRFSGDSSGFVAVRKVERRGLLQPFLACYDYGQGGIWAFIVAESSREITEAYPELRIVERTPDWVTPDVMQRIPRLALHAPPTDLLESLLNERARSR